MQDAADKTYVPSFRARMAEYVELLVGSSFGAAIIYSLFWGAFQSLAVGHFILNETRFVAASSFVPAETPAPAPPPAPTPASTPAKAPTPGSSEDGDTGSTAETGDVIEIWFASAQHRSLLRPCTVDFEFTGKTLTDYRFGSDRRTNPRGAKYLAVQGFEKNPKLPGPYIYLHFESALGNSHSYQLEFDFKKDAEGKLIGVTPDKETFVATATTGLSPWECLSVVFIGGGIKLTDFSDFTFARPPTH